MIARHSPDDTPRTVPENFALDWALSTALAAGACVGHPYAEQLWFADPSDIAARDLARSYCRRCPVADACLAAAVANDERDGIWAGLDFSSRKARRRAASIIERTAA